MYKYAGTPPDNVMITVPSHNPLHETLVCEVLIISSLGWVIVTEFVAVQRLTSATVTL